MKKTVKRKVYDTDTAQPLAYYDNGNPRGSYFHFSEMLYRTENGEYFLHGSGGSATHYSAKCGGGCRCRGEAIIPITEERAREWVKFCCDDNTFSRVFGEAA